MPVSVTFPAPIAIEHTPPPTKPQSVVKWQRPRGLWKARGTGPRRDKQDQHSSDTTDDDIDDDEYPPFHVLEAVEHSCCRRITTRFRSRKRHRSETLSTNSSDDEEEIRYWDYSRRCDSPHPERLNKWAARSKVMDVSSIARGPSPVVVQEEGEYTIEDWRDLKELFAKAAAQYEGDDPAETLLLLRAVIHECHRFLRHHRDPSLLFSPPLPEPAPVPERNWFHDEQPRYMSSERPKRKPSTPPPVEKKCKCVDLVTAFHTILGTVLFFFGNIIAQDPTLALEGEPTTAVPYWLAAFDAFETGENSPTRVNGKGCTSAPEDWRMAIMWGRTLVALADDLLARQAKLKEDNPNAPLDPFIASYLADSPKWPEASPFGAINRSRPVTTRRLSISTTTPNELLVLAMDQFSRGIFHMPHPNHLPPASSSRTAAPSPPSAVKRPPDSFSRAKELFTIGSEVLLISEKLLEPSERQTWGAWSDSIFSQMKMEADMEVWRAPIARARGRCCLIVGAARAEELEGALESGDMDVLNTEDAEDARDTLGCAIGYLEKARELGGDEEEEDREELRSLLVEALVTLANLTGDVGRREELYARAQMEGGEEFELEGMMDETE